MHTYKTTFGLLAVVLAAAMVQAAAPTINCKTDGNNLIVTYTGTLYQSSDAVKWTEVSSASSPYQVKMGNKKLFFCAKGESKNFTIPLSDTVDLNMIWIEPGTFIMGSPEDELGRFDTEVQHEVTLTKGYWMGKYEVTQAQYEVIIGTNPSDGHDVGYGNPVYGIGDDLCQTDSYREGSRKTAGGVWIYSADRSAVGICLPCRDDHSPEQRKEFVRYVQMFRNG